MTDNVNNKTIRILITGLLPTELGGFEVGGVATIVPHWAKNLSNFQDLEVFVTAPCRKEFKPKQRIMSVGNYKVFLRKKEFYYILKNYKMSDVLRLAFSKILRKLKIQFNNIEKFTLFELEISSILGNIRPDIIIIHDFFEEALTTINKRTKSKIITFVHGIQLNENTLDDLPDKTRLYYFNIIKEIFDKSNFIAFSSSYNLEIAKKTDLLKINSNFAVLNDGVDTDFYKPFDKNQCKNKLGVDNDKKVLLFVGSLTPRKSVHLLLEAVANISPSLLSTINLVIIGDGAEYSKLKDLSNKLNIVDKVKFIGNIYNKIQLRDWYNASDIFVLPSKSEGLAISILEAMACGTPVISCKPSLGSYENLKDKQTCLLVNYDDINNLTCSIETLLFNNKLASNISENARKLIFEKFTWEKRSEELYNVIKKMETEI